MFQFSSCAETISPRICRPAVPRERDSISNARPSSAATEQAPWGERNLTCFGNRCRLPQGALLPHEWMAWLGLIELRRLQRTVLALPWNIGVVISMYSKAVSPSDYEATSRVAGRLRPTTNHSAATHNQYSTYACSELPNPTATPIRIVIFVVVTAGLECPFPLGNGGVI